MQIDLPVIGLSELYLPHEALSSYIQVSFPIYRNYDPDTEAAYLVTKAKELFKANSDKPYISVRPLPLSQNGLPEGSTVTIFNKTYPRYQLQGRLHLYEQDKTFKWWPSYPEVSQAARDKLNNHFATVFCYDFLLDFYAKALLKANQETLQGLSDMAEQAQQLSLALQKAHNYLVRQWPTITNETKEKTID